MWQVDNRTPFACDRGWVRDRDGAEIWIVAVKCTFDIGPDGSTEVSQEQSPVLRVPEYHGEPGKSSIKYEADLVLAKTTTDVIVVGHAYAPRGRAVSMLDAGFRLGSLQKLLRITGDRRWRKLGVSAPEPFQSMPLTFERSFGGTDVCSDNPEVDWDWRNPVGVGFATRKSHLADRDLPNIEYEKDRFAAWKDRPHPAGFGPIAGHWQPRLSHAGTYDDHWMKTRQPLLPADFDDRYFQCAPDDQQLAEFARGGESVELFNLTPDGHLSFVLPRLHLGFETRFYDGSREIHKSRKLHTIIIEPDFPRVSLVWHTALFCHTRVHKLARTIVTLKTPLRDSVTLDPNTETGVVRRAG